MAEPIEPTLMAMPEDVMRKILKWCDYVSVQCLRKTCHNFRDFINAIWPNPPIRFIEITGTSDSIKLVFCGGGDSSWSLYPVGQKFDVTYQKINEKDTEIDWNRGDGHRVKTIKNSNFLDFFSQDLASSLECKLTNLSWISINCDENGYRTIQKALESSSNTPIKVAMLDMESVTSQEDIMGILPYICSKTLNHLKISGVRDCNLEWDLSNVLDLSKVVELEQWKKIKKLIMYQIAVRAGIQNYHHFATAFACFDEIKADDLMKIKENLLTCSSLNKNREVHFRRLPDRDVLIKSLGLPKLPVHPKLHWYFHRPDKRLLHIELSRRSVIFDIQTAPNF